MRIAFAALTLLAIAGCNTPPAGDAADVNLAANDAANAAIAGAEPPVVPCDDRPDFAPVRDDARITTCTSGPTAGGLTSGTIIYTTAADPRAVKDWAKEQVRGAGLTGNIEADTPHPMYSAREGTRRTMMLLTEPHGGGTRVTVNWGREG